MEPWNRAALHFLSLAIETLAVGYLSAKCQLKSNAMLCFALCRATHFPHLLRGKWCFMSDEADSYESFVFVLEDTAVGG